MEFDIRLNTERSFQSTELVRVFKHAHCMHPTRSHTANLTMHATYCTGFWTPVSTINRLAFLCHFRQQILDYHVVEINSAVTQI